LSAPRKRPYWTSSKNIEGEIVMLDHILKFMTLGTVIVGSMAIYTALHTNNRRLGADIFLRYSDRISDLRRSLPTTAFFEPDVPVSVEMTTRGATSGARGHLFNL
jgi:hypothetical protein